MNESIIKVIHLSHRYNVQWAVRDINFEINHHGVIGLLGSNGAGKSTMMNIICGVLNQTEGSIFINGIDLAESPVEAKRNIGFLPQKPPLYGDLNVEEYLTYCANLRLMDKRVIANSVKNVMIKCGIIHFRKRLIRNLSGGYQQRVGIAQSMVHDPQFVVLDEPTNGLDPNQILEIRELIREIAQDRAVLLSTHILSEVQATCSHIKMIEQGKMVFSGTLDEFDNYIEPSVFRAVWVNPPTEEEMLKIPGVYGVEKITDQQYRIKFSENDKITHNVIELSVTNGWGLSEITLEKNSLDEIFAYLSGKRNKETIIENYENN